MAFVLSNVIYKDVLNIGELTIGQSPVTCITGSSGGGKTTLLRLLCRMIAPDSGDILLDGQPISQCDATAYRRRVTMLPQQPVIYDGSIRDNLITGFTLRNQKPPEDGALLNVLDILGLQKSLDDDAFHLSGGEKQRVCMGRVLLLKSNIYLLDEPSGALDADTEDRVIGAVADSIAAMGSSLIMVTHSANLAEKFAMSHIRIENGRAEVLQ